MDDAGTTGTIEQEATTGWQDAKTVFNDLVNFEASIKAAGLPGIVAVLSDLIQKHYGVTI
jgi:hypothetical protein